MSKFNIRFIWTVSFTFLQIVNVSVSVFAILTYKNNFGIFIALMFLFIVFNATIGAILFSFLYGEGFVRGVQSFPQTIKLMITEGLEINTYRENIDNDEPLH